MNILEIKEQARRKNLLEQLSNLSKYNKLWLWNSYCDTNNYFDDKVYINDEEFFQTFYSGTSYMKLLEDTSGDDYKPSDDFVVNTIYGLKSSDHVENLINWDVNTLATYCEYNCPEEIDWDDNENAADKAIMDALEQAIKQLNVSFNLEDVFTYVIEYGDEEKTPLQHVQDCIDDGWDK